MNNHRWPQLVLTGIAWAFISVAYAQQNETAPPASTEAVEQNSKPEATPANDDQATAPAPTKKRLESVSVESKPIQVFSAFSGVLESKRTTEIKTGFDVWTEAIIESVVDQGTIVTEGTTMIKFKTDKIDKAITEAEFAFKNAEFDLLRAELDLKLAKQTFELDRDAAERAWKEAQDDYEYYLQTELPNQKDDIEHEKKSAGYSLEYAKDELDQLEKMYLEDELTEESEAIVLKRAQRGVEQAERYNKRTLTRIARQEAIDVPRQQKAREVALKRAEMAWQRSQITLPIAAQTAEIAFAQTKHNYDMKRKHLGELKSDREKFEIKATSTGTVYYGQCIRGKWSGRKLEVDQKVGPNATVLTIVDTSALAIRAGLSEDKVKLALPRLRGKAIANTADARPFPVVIQTIAPVAGEDDKFDAAIAIESVPADSILLPGTGVKLSFPIANRQALVLPKSSVFSDDDGVSHFVFIVDDDQAKRHDVITGLTIGDKIEILEGLKEGDKVTKERQ